MLEQNDDLRAQLELASKELENLSRRLEQHDDILQGVSISLESNRLETLRVINMK